MADVRLNNHCRSCGAPIFWARHKHSGNSLPVDYDPVDDGNVAVVPGQEITVVVYENHDKLVESEGHVPSYKSHFATCPNAPEWRKSKPSTSEIFRRPRPPSGLPGERMF